MIITGTISEKRGDGETFAAISLRPDQSPDGRIEILYGENFAALDAFSEGDTITITVEKP